MGLRPHLGFVSAASFLVLAPVLGAQLGFVWEQRAATLRPPARGDTNIVHDSARGRVVLFGGGGGGALNDTWEWDGTQWLQRLPAHSPPALSAIRAAYDGVRQRTVYFGGGAPSGDSAATWLWDGSDWVDAAPAQRPPARNSHAMAFDSSRGMVVLFGGAFGGVGATYADTWEWDGTNWTQRAPSHSPPARARHAMAFDAARGRVVVYGGTDSSFSYLGDTWEWDGVDWVQRVASNPPSPRVYSAMAYDSGRDRLVVFGGDGTTGALADLWELRQDETGRYDTFGAGCAGWAGVPYLAIAGPVPSLGNFFTVYARNLPPDHSAMMWLGASRTSTYGLPLPIDLGFAGMPGCVLYVSLDLAMPMFNWSGAAAWTVMVPNQPALLGVRFYNQVFAVDRVANPLGAVVTNAGAGVIGR